LIASDPATDDCKFVPKSEAELKKAVAKQPVAAAISGYSRKFFCWDIMMMLE
jgi:hypothetical protein